MSDRLKTVAALVAVGVAAVVVSATAAGPIASGVRRVFSTLTPNRFLWLLGLAFVAALAAALLRRSHRRPPASPGAPLAAGTAWPVWVGAIAAAAGVVWFSLGRATVVPRIFGDELTHGEAARNLAQHGSLATHGYGLVTPVIDAVAYLATSNEVRSYHLVQALNAAVIVTAAFLAYPLARRALSAHWALVVAALTVAVPWLTYTRFFLTEPDFYPAFLLFALVLVRALEQPTWRRQLLVAAALALTYLTRTQALALAGAVVVAIPLYGLAQDRLRATLRAWAPTWTLYGVALAGLSLATAAGSWSPVGPYRSLIDGWQHPHGLAIWIAANLTALFLGLGVLVGVAAPLGAAMLLRRTASSGEAALAAVTVAATAALLASVSLLSESVAGQGSVHERDLFFAAPLVIACALAWATNGFPRPKVVTGLIAVAVIGFAAAVPHGAVNAHLVDALSFKLWAQIDTGPLSPSAWIVAATATGALVVATLRSAWPLVLTVALAAVGVAAASDYRSTENRAEAARYVWVDRAVPGGAGVTVLYVGYARPACAHGVTPSPLPKMSLYTEYFNARVDHVGHLLADNAARGVASTQYALGPKGAVTSAGRPLSPGYVVTDARLAVAGTRLATLSANAVMPGAPAGAGLALWRVSGPLRLTRPAQVLQPGPLACG